MDGLHLTYNSRIYF